MDLGLPLSHSYGHWRSQGHRRRHHRGGWTHNGVQVGPRLGSAAQSNIRTTQREEIATIAAQREAGHGDLGDVTSGNLSGDDRADHAVEIRMGLARAGDRRKTGLGKQFAKSGLGPARRAGIAQLKDACSERFETVEHACHRTLHASQARPRRSLRTR